MTKNTTPRALREYRALDAEARRTYDPSNKPGDDAVRRLQMIASTISALREARHQARTNPQYPSWCLRLAQDNLRDLANRGDGLPRDAVTRYHTLPLGQQDADIATTAAHAAHPRRKNWFPAEPFLWVVGTGACVEYPIQYRGNFRRLYGANWAPTMRALVRISQHGAILTALIGYANGGERPEAAYTIQAGRGYQWQTDTQGVRLVRLADGADYHPDTDEVRAGRAAIIAALRERDATRKAAAKVARREAEILKRASRGGVWVCLGDSVSAGNCRTGTESFARRHNLDMHLHYRADTLPVPATSEESRRIALAVLAAQRRQARELDAGSCAV